MAEGKEPLAKDKLCELLNKIFEPNEESKPPSRPEVIRRVSAGAMLVAVLTNEFSQVENFFAEIEAWSVFISLSIQFVLKQGLACSEISSEISIARDLIQERAIRLTNEATSKGILLEGDFLMDKLVLPVRLTWLLGIACSLQLLGYDGDLSLIQSIIDRYALQSMVLWGEASIPYYLPLIWLLERRSPQDAKTLLLYLIKTLCTYNSPYSNIPIANPYYAATDILKWTAGIEPPPNDKFSGTSFFLFHLLCIAVRRGWKEELKELWPHISLILIRQIEVKGHERFAWRAKNTVDRTSPLPMEGKWEDLVELSNFSAEDDLPLLVTDDPALLLLTCQVFPHRMTVGVANFLDMKFGNISK